MSGKQLTIGANVNTEEGEGPVIGAALRYTSSNEVLHVAARGNRAGEGANNSKRVRVNPQSASTNRSQVVKDTLLIEVVIKDELSGNSRGC